MDTRFLNHELNKDLIIILIQFKKEDYKKFHAFLDSPYFNKQFGLRQSLEQLKKLLTFIEGDNLLTRNNACKAIWGEISRSERDEQNLANVMSDLLKVLKQFIFWENISKHDKNDFREQLALARFYFENKLTDSFDKSVVSLDLIQESEPVKGSRYFYNEFLWKHLKAEAVTLRDNQTSELNLPDIVQSLDYFYATHIMELMCHLKNRKRQVNSEESISSPLLCETVISLVHEGKIHTPLLGIYSQILHILDNDTFDRSLVIDLEEYIKIHQTLIPFEKLLDIMAYIRNFWTALYFRIQDINALSDLFEVYKNHWRNGKKDNLWQRYGQFLPNTIQSAVTIALKLHTHYSIDNQETEYSTWVKTFLENFPTEKIFQKDGDPETIIDYCWANYFICMKQYINAEEKIAPLYINYKNPYRKFYAALLLSEIYFVNQPNLFDDFVGRFRTWLSRQKDFPDENKKLIREKFNAKINDLKK
jgi:hypothetical protein